MCLNSFGLRKVLFHFIILFSKNSISLPILFSLLISLIIIIPSFLVSESDEIIIKEKSRANAQINDNLEAVARRGVPSWVELDKDSFKGTVKTLPNREEITMPIQEQLIVELYSK